MQLLRTLSLIVLASPALAESPWRFINLPDWHSAEKYVSVWPSAFSIRTSNCERERATYTEVAVQCIVADEVDCYFCVRVAFSFAVGGADRFRLPHPNTKKMFRTSIARSVRRRIVIDARRNRSKQKTPSVMQWHRRRFASWKSSNNNR